MNLKFKVFTYSNTLLLLLLLSHLLLLYKLNFFIDFISGNIKLWDFDAYYSLSKLILSGKNPYEAKTMQTLGPPIAILPYVPFSYFPIKVARGFTTVINIISGYLACQILAKKYFRSYPKHAFLILSTALFSSFPARFSLIVGQLLLFSTLLVTLMIVKTNTYIITLATSLLITIKSFFVFIPLAFLRRNRKLFITTFVFLVVIVIASSTLIKYQYYESFISKMLNPLINTQFIGIDYYNQTLATTLNRLGLQLLFFPILAMLLIFILINTIILGNIVSTISLSFLISPVVWQHHFVILFPVFIWSFNKSLKTNRKLAIPVFVAFLLYWIEFPFLHRKEHLFINAILASHYFVSAAILTYTTYKLEMREK